MAWFRKKYREPVTLLDYVEKAVAEWSVTHPADWRKPVKTEWGPVLNDSQSYSSQLEAEDRCSRLGGSAVDQAVLDRLADLLRNPASRDLREFALRMVVAIGEAAATPPILTAIAELFHEWEMADKAEAAVKRLGPAAAHPAFLDPALQALRNPEGSACCRTPLAGALAAIGEPAARCPGFSAKLVQLLDRFGEGFHCDSGEGEFDSHQFWNGDFEYSVRHVVRGMGEEALSPGFLHLVAQLIRDGRSSYSRGAALSVVADLGSRAVTPEVREVAAQLLHHEELGLRARACRVIGKSPTIADCPEILGGLVSLMVDAVDPGVGYNRNGWPGHIDDSVYRAMKRLGDLASETIQERGEEFVSKTRTTLQRAAENPSEEDIRWLSPNRAWLEDARYAARKALSEYRL